MSLRSPANQMPLKDQGSGLDLVFITQTGPKKNKEVQSQIRKHVMRDIGKARRKEGKRVLPIRFTLDVPGSLENLGVPPEVELHDPVQLPNQPGIPWQTAPSVIQDASIPSESGGPHDEVDPFVQQQAMLVNSFSAPAIERLWTGRMDPFMKYPIKMDRKSLQLMDHVFDDRYGNTPPYRDAWLPVGMIDAATFHQVLSNAALNLASLRARDRAPETHDSMVHHTKAVTLVKQNMSNKRTATSDSVIASITAFACYAHVTGNQVGWHMHMNAVKEIVRLRGGIENLNPNRLLRIIIFWVDIGGACTEDIPALFPIPTKLLRESLGPEQFIPPAPLAAQLSRSWSETFPDHPEIINIMNDIRSFMTYLQTEVRRTQGGAYRRGELAASNILPIQHRLLNLIVPYNADDNDDNDSDAQQKVEILRIGCTLFIAELRRMFGIMGVISSVQISKLRGLLRAQRRGWGRMKLFKAWVLAMGAMESRGEDRAWLFGELEIARMEAGIGGWDELQDTFRQILWYEEVHDQMFVELCNGVEPIDKEGHLLGGSRFGGYRPLQS